MQKIPSPAAQRRAHHVLQCHMQARANDMHTLATSSFNAKMRALGGGSPDNPGMHRGLLVEMRKMHRRGVVDSLECARSAPAKAEGGWFVGAQRNLALSISESPHHSKSILPYCQPTSQPSECILPLLADLANTDYS